MNCREPYKAPPELIEELELDELIAGKSVQLYRAIACEKCASTGYLGRTIIAEFLTMSEKIRRQIQAHGDGTSLQQTAIEEGMMSMKSYGLHKALKGETTIEEINRVIQ